MLRSIPKGDIQKICSGQSVVDLATAVKELVENALDAGATTVEIKLKEFGQVGFEVSDNGKGIPAADHAAIALKHYTSKISAFEDLESVASFGFRGEALSSICQLARSFSVLTRTKDDSIGTLLEYDNTGSLVSSVGYARTKKARAVGTTVIVDDLFQPLPVRYKDFVKNIKKHYSKTLRVLQGYAVMSSNVKLSCVNIMGKTNQRQEVLSTQINQTIADNIANVFGSKFLKTLLVVDIPLPLGDGAVGQIIGFVSKVGAGVGRSDNDRQFFFVNGRPVDLLNATKAVNEIWRQYEMKQKPACMLNFVLPSGVVDVNVTPDKRETFIRDELHIVERLKEGLNAMYEPSRGTFQVQSLLPMASQGTTKTTGDAPPPSKRKRVDEPKQANSVPVVAESKHEAEKDENPPKRRRQETPSPETDNNVVDVTPRYLHRETSPADEVVVLSESPAVARPNIPSKLPSSESTPTKTSAQTPTRRHSSQRDEADDAQFRTPAIPAPKATSISAKKETPTKRTVFAISKASMSDVRHQRKLFFQQQKQQALPVPTRAIPSACAVETCDDAEEATAALQRVLSKADFSRMEVIGQFNLGFIIARLDSDLFIIDQHASDEKFRYETLQRTTVIHQQPLVRPMSMELTAVEEMTILDHLAIFKKQGFHFQVDEGAPVTQKLKLISLPFSKHTQWGVDDVRELVSLLLENPHPPSTIRLPKTLAMFASRACRSAVMIGTALKKEEMQKIVGQLADLEQPWNCPHGRPTMRHLVDLSEVGNA
ncbi:Aste57867_19480 [Aphanomyces stellatus]|uniref:Aste57867_19480 protein n=1 Tax=Aphanomyces stellatus TaxID=120398 RepID=A0A485LCN4_9STRA|nr:hypothetical protein As57867_019416 [Aphanomyces stellatus]VFT96191.1 Aste57867_19480 [Aphanomyces stellatus]